MKIEYLGHSCFRIVSEKGTTVVTDPYTKVGYELSADLQADVVTISHGHFDHNYTKGVQSKKIWDKAQAYVYNDVSAKAFVCNHDERGGALRGKNIVFIIFVDGVSVCHLGDLGESCSKEILDKIGHPDVLLIPIGGTYTIDAKEAFAYVEAIQPKIAVPMHYRPQDGVLDITSAENFLQMYKNVIYAEKDKATDVMAFASNQTQIVFMERSKNE